MATLNTEPNLASTRRFLRAIDRHASRSLSEAESVRVNAKLILLLANHIGDPQVLEQAMEAAREHAESPIR